MFLRDKRKLIPSVFDVTKVYKVVLILILMLIHPGMPVLTD